MHSILPKVIIMVWYNIVISQGLIKFPSLDKFINMENRMLFLCGVDVLNLISGQC